MFTMFILFFGGLIFVGFIFVVGTGGRSCYFPSEKRVEHHDIIRKIEQELQQVKNRARCDLPW